MREKNILTTILSVVVIIGFVLTSASSIGNNTFSAKQIVTNPMPTIAPQTSNKASYDRIPPNLDPRLPLNGIMLGRDTDLLLFEPEAILDHQLLSTKAQNSMILLKLRSFYEISLQIKGIVKL
jgi:hypothetical protein